MIIPLQVHRADLKENPITADNSWKAFYEKHAVLNALGKLYNSL
jgi:hypothetical protein